MVKNRNFQVRVEESVARRKQAKERKKKSDDRRQYKALAHSCLKQIDAVMASQALAKLLEEWARQQHQQDQEPAPVWVTLHVWTDQRGTRTAATTNTIQDEKAIQSSALTSTVEDNVTSVDGGEGGDDPLEASESTATSRRSSTSSLVAVGAEVSWDPATTSVNTSTRTRQKQKQKQTRGTKGRNRSVSLGNQHDDIYQTTNAASLDSSPAFTSCNPKGRLRSNSMPEHHNPNTKSTTNNTKCHPASSYKQQQQQQQQQWHDDTTNPLCCRADFFRATCRMSHTATSTSRKKTGASCRYIHYHQTMDWHEHASALPYSLYQVVVGQHQNQNNNNNNNLSQENGSWEHELFLSEQAAAASLPDQLQESDPHAFEMVYHYQLSQVLNVSSAGCDGGDNHNNNDNNNNKNWSSKIGALLQEHHLNVSNIVYLCLGSALVYDRYRDGWLCSQHDDQDELLLRMLHNNTSVPHTCNNHPHHNPAAAGMLRMRRKESLGSDYSEEDLRDAVLQLPGIVLEHILTFLPDAAVAVVSQVCRAWNVEIGQQSPHLWRYLLERRQWPLPLLDAETMAMNNHHNCHKNETELYRDAFTNHYTVVRNVNALQHGVAAIMKRQHVAEDEKKSEVAFQNFLSRNDSPDAQSPCVVHVWSPHRILAAYKLDCSLRLFEAAATTNKTFSESSNNTASSTSRLVCKEVVCQRVDLCHYTKKKACTLKTIGLDEKYIVSLCREVDVDTDKQRFIFVVMTREAFLVGSENNKAAVLASEENYSLIDVGETCLAYVVENSEFFDPHCVQQILEFLDEGGALRDIHITVSDHIGSCGCGLFLLEIVITNLHMTPDDADMDTAIHTTLDRKIVLFSVELGAIVWVGESIPHIIHPIDDVRISCYRQPSLAGTSSSCTFAVAWGSALAMLVGNVEVKGNALDIKSFHLSGSEREEVSELRWFRSSNWIATTSTDVIAGDVWVRNRARDSLSEKKCVLSFYQFSPSKNDWDCTKLTLEGNLAITSLACTDNNHILILCNRYPTGSREGERNEGGLAPGEGDRNAEGVNNNNNNNEGAWAGPARHRILWPDLVAIVVDIASRQEIYRGCWWPDFDFRDWFPRSNFVAAASMSGGTFALGLSGKGIIMTGQDVRDRLASSPGCFSPRSSPKKKKKGKAPRSSMKDGLVRGKRMYF